MMAKNTRKEIDMHISDDRGPVKRPFEDLVHYESSEELSNQFIKKWVVPFYMIKTNSVVQSKKNYDHIKADLTIDIAKLLLGQFNWRSKIAGAYFAAIEDYSALEEIIGIHLLKSQVCYAGKGYCLALATFNSARSIEYLNKYLTYYLQKTDLVFEQIEAMAALNWLDQLNGTKLAEPHKKK